MIIDNRFTINVLRTSLIPLCSACRHQVHAYSDEHEGDGLVPGEDVLSEGDGHAGGDQGLQVAVHTHRGGTDIPQTHGQQEIGDHRGEDEHREEVEISAGRRVAEE